MGISREALHRWDSQRKFAELALRKAAKDTANSLGLSEADVEKALKRIGLDFMMVKIETDQIENAAKAKRDILKLAEKADEFREAILALGQGALEMMKSPINQPELTMEADPSGLPEKNPIKLFFTRYDDEEVEKLRRDDERGGAWIIRVRALGELARQKASQIESLAGRGGRIPFGTRLIGSPEQTLANACKEFAETRGCMSQSVPLAMMRGIMESVQGHKLDAHVGRKAIRRVAQTKPKPGTV